MTHPRIPDLTARIISAYVSANTVAGEDLPALIRQVGDALDAAGRPVEVPAEPLRPTPGAIRRSVRHDSLVSFLDGRAYKTLRRHLNRQGLTEADYRARFGLPSDYPMTATEYRERRSAMAKAAGLGHGRQRPAS